MDGLSTHARVPSLIIMNDIDLNYRMDISDHEMRKTLSEDDWENGPKFEALLRFDQVRSLYLPSLCQNHSYLLLI